MSGNPVRWLFRTRPGLTIVLSLAFIGLAVLIVGSLPKPNVLVSADLDAESADVRVLNPDDMLLYLPRALVDDGAPGCREAVTVRVDRGGSLAFSRRAGGALHVVTSGQTQWRTEDGASGTAAQGLYLEVADEGDCAWTGLLRLPVVGEMGVGTLASGATRGEDFLPLTRGELNIYGRAIDPPWPFSWLSGLIEYAPEKLYPAGSFTVPAGSQVEGGEARFWGFIAAEIGGDGALHIEASTNARELSVLAPAPRSSDDDPSSRATALEPDKVSLTLGAWVAGDPNLHLMFWALGGVLAAIGLAINFAPVLVGEKKDAEKKAEAKDTAAPAKAEPVKVEPAKVEPAKVEPVKVEPAPAPAGGAPAGAS